MVQPVGLVVSPAALAEERGLLPTTGLYLDNYSVIGLFERLARRRRPVHRHDGW